MQYLQPTQRELSMVTMLVAGSMCAAPVGQTLTQGGSEHCWQDTRTYLRLPGVPSSGDWRSSVMRS